MAGLSKTPKEKKQASLTSFFTPKTVNGLTQQLPSSPSAPSTAAPSTKPALTSIPPPHSRKRPLQEAADGGKEPPPRPAKRVRPVTRSKRIQKSEPAASDDDGDKDEDDKDEDDKDEDDKDDEWTESASNKPAPPPRNASTLLHALAPSSPKNSATPANSANSARTERYAYDAARSRGHMPEEDEQDDAATKRKKEELHRKFVQKLGHPDSLGRWRTVGNDASPTPGLDGEDVEAGDDADEEEPPAPAAKTRKKGAKTGKLTPMETQFLDIKRKHMDTVLIVEVGYKFKFFGEDARIAAKELSIVCIPGKFRYDEHPSEAHLDKFASASVPVHRLHVHAKRLVAAGHKVGVVRQVETAALKKAGDNRNAPFVRKLTNIYTKGTYIDEGGDLAQAAENGGAPSGGYLLCLTESKAKGSGTDEKVDVGIIAVQPATGDIIYDEFEDGFMRREIETRLLHISPCEFLIVGHLSKATDKLIQHLSGSTTNVFGDRSRVERVSKSSAMETEANSHVTQFYAGKVKDGDDRSAALLEKVLQLPKDVITCLSAMITHLTEYGLEHIFDLTKYFQSFSTQQHMLLNGTTLESLEVYRNATDHSEKGSLFWALDKTRTRYGQRLLRKWVGRPLLDQERLQERMDAVQELVENQSNPKVDKLKGVLTTRNDLERSLIRIFYGKCTRPELLSTLQTLQRIGSQFMCVTSPTDTGFQSRLLADAICTLPAIGPIVESFLSKFNADAARRDEKYGFFREEEENDDITNHKLGIVSVEQDLDAHRRDAAAQLSKKTPVIYVTVSGIEYLIEVTNADIKRVPASWAKISGTKKLSRFHTPEVVRLMSERDQHKEALAAACDAAFAALLCDVAAEYQPLRDAVAALATLDCLLSLAQVAALPGYCKPEFLPARDPETGAATPASVSIREGRHPICEHTLPGGYIPFSTSLSGAAAGPLAQLITGPNMGGKSSYVRAVALLVLLAQVGSYVPAAGMRLTPADAIHTRMGARDNLFRGESTFMVEVSETAAILRAATPRSLVVLDELGRGTSTHDGAAIAQAVLDHAARDVRCLTLFITHYQGLARVADGLGRGLVRCVHMRFTTASGAGAGEEEKEEKRDSTDEADQEITFLYEVGEGVAHRSYGLNVARLARIPRRVLEVAARKSREMEDGVNARRLRAAAGLLRDVLHGSGGGGGVEDGGGDGVVREKEDGGGLGDQLGHLIASVDQL